RQKGSRDPAFVDPALVAPERCVGQVRPRPSVTCIGVRCTWPDGRIVADRHRSPREGSLRLAFGERRRVRWWHRLVGRSVVAEEDDECVLVDAALGYRLHHRPYRLVHAVDLCGIDRHPATLPPFVVDVVPCGFVWVALAEFCFITEYARGAHLFEATSSQLVPAVVEPVGVTGDVLLGSVEWPMRGGERQVQKERLVVFGLLPDERCPMFADGVGEVVTLIGDRK